MSRRKPYPPEVRASAELLFVIERRTPDAVCELTGISRSTFDRWRKEGKWDEKRGLEVIAVPYLVRELLKDMQRTVQQARDEDRPLTAGERDGLYKTQKMIQQLDKGALFASHALQALDLFRAFLQDAAPDLYDDVVPHLGTFAERVARNYAQ